MATYWRYRIDESTESEAILFRDLVALARNGGLSPDQLVRPEWQDEWQRADETVGLLHMATRAEDEPADQQTAPSAVEEPATVTEAPQPTDQPTLTVSRWRWWFWSVLEWVSPRTAPPAILLDAEDASDESASPAGTTVPQPDFTASERFGGNGTPSGRIPLSAPTPSPDADEDETTETSWADQPSDLPGLPESAVSRAPVADASAEVGGGPADGAAWDAAIGDAIETLEERDRAGWKLFGSRAAAENRAAAWQRHSFRGMVAVVCGGLTGWWIVSWSTRARFRFPTEESVDQYVFPGMSYVHPGEFVFLLIDAILFAAAAGYGLAWWLESHAADG